MKCSAEQEKNIRNRVLALNYHNFRSFVFTAVFLTLINLGQEPQEYLATCLKAALLDGIEWLRCRKRCRKR